LEEKQQKLRKAKKRLSFQGRELLTSNIFEVHGVALDQATHTDDYVHSFRSR
jgi:hypothetical protein